MNFFFSLIILSRNLLLVYLISVSLLDFISLLVPLLPTFHGMEIENPYSHIREFEGVYNTFKEETATVDLMRLKLFPFTLKDNLKIWLNSLRPRSI